jgi:hypothetical protein
MRFISRTQMLYISEHPVVFWFSIGICFAGFTSLVAPQFTEQSSASLLLPDWLRATFNVTYAAGGFGSVFGIIRGWRKIEAAGMALLASGLLTNFIVFSWVVPSGLVSAAFLLTLAIGCAQRSWHLATTPPIRIER